MLKKISAKHKSENSVNIINQFLGMAYGLPVGSALGPVIGAKEGARRLVYEIEHADALWKALTIKPIKGVTYFALIIAFASLLAPLGGGYVGKKVGLSKGFKTIPKILADPQMFFGLDYLPEDERAHPVFSPSVEKKLCENHKLCAHRG